METVTDILVPFTHRDPAVGLGQNYRADEARGPGSNNFNLVIAGGGMVGHRCHHPAAFRHPVPSCLLESRVQPQDPPTGTMRQRTSLSTSLCDDARHPSPAETCVNTCEVRFPRRPFLRDLLHHIGAFRTCRKLFRPAGHANGAEPWPTVLIICRRTKPEVGPYGCRRCGHQTRFPPRREWRSLRNRCRQRPRPPHCRYQLCS